MLYFQFDTMVQAAAYGAILSAIAVLDILAIALYVRITTGGN